jgi:hypothetical protein
MTEQRFNELTELRDRITNLKVIKLRISGAMKHHQISVDFKVRVFDQVTSNYIQEHSLVPPETSKEDFEHITSSIQNRISELQEEFDKA